MSLFEASRPEPTPHAAVATQDIDVALSAQLVVAWGGESGEEPRLGWWRSDLVSEYGGEDLFRRLLPHTWRWAVLQGAREAARRRDAELRSQAHDPDAILSLFNLGFEIEERVEERLQELKRSRPSPADLRGTDVIYSGQWSRGAFAAWVESHGKGEFAVAPVGRRLSGAPPPSLPALVAQLVAALHPLADAYPLPHFQRRP